MKNVFTIILISLAVCVGGNPLLRLVDLCKY